MFTGASIGVFPNVNQQLTPILPAIPVLPAVDPDPPSLTAAQVWAFSLRFRDESMNMQYLWRCCFDAVTGWRAYQQPDGAQRYGMEVQWFNRARDVSFNITTPMYRTISSLLALEMPVWGATPAVESPADIVRSNASKVALRYDWEKCELGDQYTEMIDYGIITGTSASLTCMNGDSLAPEEIFGPDRIRAEPGIGNPDKSRFLAVTRLTTKDALLKRFPDKKDAIAGAPRPEQLAPSQDGWQRLPEDRVEVLEAYCRSGHWFLMVGPNPSDILASGITPKRCMPLGIHRYTTIPGQFWGLGALELMLSAQYAFSQAVNQILKNARLTNNPKVLVNRLTNLDPNAFTAQQGEKVFYDGQAPSFMRLEPMSQYAAQIPANMQAIARDEVGVHGVTTGAREVGVVTGAAVNAMTSNDKAQFSATTRDVKKMVRRKAKIRLLYMIEFYPEEKEIAQFDRYGAGMYSALKSTDLGDNPNVLFDASSLFAYDVEARQARIAALMHNGAISPADGLKMLRDNTDPLDNAKPVADYKEAADALNRVIQLGYEVVDTRQPPQVDPATGAMIPIKRKVVRLYPTDNFEVFANVVKSYIRSPDFDALSIDRQDEIEKYYLDLLDKLAPPPMPGMPPDGNASIKPPQQLPAPAAPPAPKSAPVQADRTMDHKAAISVDRAEAT